MADPTKPKPKPLTPFWQRHVDSPLVQDTLRRITGGKLPTYVMANTPPPARDVVARFVFPDTVKFYLPSTTTDSIGDYVITHETGHYMDALGTIFPTLSTRVSQTSAQQKKLGGYAATNEDEQMAEAIAAGTAALRLPTAQQDSAANTAEKRIIGARLAFDLIRDLLNRAAPKQPAESTAVAPQFNQ